MRVAGDDLIARIPVIRVLDRIGIHVPAVASIPVRVHGPEHLCAQCRLYHHP